MGSSPIGSIAAESEIFLGESGFPPFLFSPRKGCEEETFWASKEEDLSEGEGVFSIECQTAELCTSLQKD